MTTKGRDNDETDRPAPVFVTELLREVEPMGDLSRFVIDDLRPDEEDEFFRILDES